MFAEKTAIWGTEQLMQIYGEGEDRVLIDRDDIKELVNGRDCETAVNDSRHSHEREAISGNGTGEEAVDCGDNG